MITITNNKVLGFVPRWATYPGFSLLFDNPGDSVSPMTEDGGLVKIDNAITDTGELSLYQAFVDTFSELGVPLLTNTYLFCPLPPYSYHLTVWDSINLGNIGSVSNLADREILEPFIFEFPGAFLRENRFTEVINASPLVTATDWNISFKFRDLAKWGNSAIVARLKPADAQSEAVLKRVADQREALYNKFPVQISHREFSPHITLGYFGNRESAQLTTPLIDAWTELMQASTDKLSITFNSISLYGFTDMVTFFKEVSQ
jgi:2'-5' RNA ligase